MSKDRKILYIVSITLVVVLLGLLCLPSKNGRAIAALVAAVFAVIIFCLIKKRPILSVNKNMVLLIMLAMGAVCLVLYYLTGVHFGFYKSSTPLSMRSFFKNILPIATIIIAIEMIRYVLIAQNAKFMGVLAYIAGVFSELLVFSTFESITTFNRFMDAMGLYLLPAIMANLLYNFLGKNYGFLPGILYRLIMTLYPYVFPLYPQTPDAIFSFAKIVVPLFIYVFIRALFYTQKHYEKPKTMAIKLISMGLSAIFMISIVALITGEFRYRAIIVATESMTGSLNKGDAVIYKEYIDHYIQEQDVLIFIRNDDRIVHRVINIERIDGTNRYYTKGDANKDADTGYITDADIEGIVLFKIPYIGYASIWLRDLFEK